MICKGCGIEFTQEHKYRKLFCCRECMHLFYSKKENRKEKKIHSHICATCGNVFYNSRKKEGTFCSSECLHNFNIFIIEGVYHKRCTGCGIIKIRKDNFYESLKYHTRDGFAPRCIQCELDYYKTEKGRAVHKKSAIKCKDKARITERIRRQRPEVKQARSAQESTQRVIDNNFALRCRMRVLIYAALRRTQRSKKLEEMIGYSAEELRIYIKKMIMNIDGMTWDLLMQGKIHIDHKVPASKFNYTSINDDDFKKCWSLDNLQPMWGSDNLEKGSRV